MVVDLTMNTDIRDQILIGLAKKISDPKLFVVIAEAEEIEFENKGVVYTSQLKCRSSARLLTVKKSCI
jgi:hypothetical protein